MPEEIIIAIAMKIMPILKIEKSWPSSFGKKLLSR
jgi:hypothetical protein